MTTTGTTTIASILEQAPVVAAEWAGERADRQQRTPSRPRRLRPPGPHRRPYAGRARRPGRPLGNPGTIRPPHLLNAARAGRRRPLHHPGQRHAPPGAFLLAVAHRAGPLHRRLGQTAPRRLRQRPQRLAGGEPSSANPAPAATPPALPASAPPTASANSATASPAKNTSAAAPA